MRPFEVVASEPSRVQATVAALDVPTRQWGTVLTFVAADLTGMLLVLAGVVLAAHGVAPAAVAGIYEAAPVVLVGCLLACTLTGLYRRRFAHPALEMERIGGLAMLVGLVGGGTLALGPGAPAHSLLLVGGGLLGAVVLPVSRALFRILFARTRWWGFPAVVVSAGPSGASVMDTLRRWPEIGIRPVAHLGDLVPSEEIDGVVRGGSEWASYLARTFDIPYVVLALPGLSHEERTVLVARYGKFFDHVFVVSDPLGAPALWTTGRSGDGLFGYGVRNVALRPGARLVKRAVDVAGALVALVVLAPVLAGIALLIRMDAPGAIFYRQERMGREGRIVTILKFRTMYADADRMLASILEQDPARRREYECYHKLQDDPRVTRIGKFLRRYSLDELPQILNVLRGEMSLVGPRAYMPSELDEMQGLARALLQSPPGMTGLWQVSGRNRLSFADRVHLDVHYIQNWSPWLDLYLLVRTVPVVFSGDGAA
jgi:Undecaprenyl-phosphate galactose phosphotransferase WbaP